MTDARAQTLKVLKTYPRESKILVDQGSSSGLVANAQVDLLSESGKEARGSVTKSTAGKAVLLVPKNQFSLFRAGDAFTFALAEASARPSAARGRKGGGRSRGSAAASNDGFISLEVNPGGLLVSSLDGGVQVRILQNLTLGLAGIFYTSDSVKGSGFGAEARYYLDRAFKEWFIGAGVLVETVTLTDTATTTESVEANPIDGYALVGYDWAFAPGFHGVFGAGVRYYSAPAKITTTGATPFEFSNPLSGVGFAVRVALAVVF